MDLKLGENETKVVHMFAKPILVGLTSYVGSTMLNKSIVADITLPVVNMDVSFHAYQGMVSAGTSLVTTTLDTWVWENFGKYGKLGSVIADLGIASAVNVGATYALFPELLKDIGVVPLVTNSIVSEGIGAYAYDNFIKDMIDKKK
jgi:hypothetical protein